MMRDRKKYFRHISLFYYRKGKNAVQARKRLREIYGEESVSTVRQCENYFSKFRSDNVKDAPRIPIESDED